MYCTRTERIIRAYPQGLPHLCWCDVSIANVVSVVKKHGMLACRDAKKILAKTQAITAA